MVDQLLSLFSLMYLVMNLMCLSVGGRSDMIQSLSSVLIWLKNTIV